MKTLVLIAVLSFGVIYVSAEDRQYNIKKAVIGNGGTIAATSPGGTYKISSTLGQVATERKDGGSYHEGFWTKIVPFDPGSVEVVDPSEGGISNYPNPLSTTTTIAYTLPTEGQVTLRIYDINGQLVSVLVDEFQGAGEKTATWDAKDATGADVASGSYLYEVQVIPSSGKGISLRNIMVVSK